MYQQLQSDMPVVIEIALKSAEQVLEAAGRLVEEPHSKDVQSLLVRGTHGVLEGTMKVIIIVFEALFLQQSYFAKSHFTGAACVG